MSAGTPREDAPLIPDHRSNQLLDSAKEFLIEALRNHGDQKGTFAIVHAVTAAELVLKARLARISPTLIHRSIDAKDLSREPTIGLRDLPQRLANLGHALDPEGARMIRLFAEWRNAIVHHLPMHDKRDARAQVPRLINFIAEYLHSDLDTSLRSFLPVDLYRLANEELEKWKVVVASAADRAQLDGPTLDDACPDCGARGVLGVGEDHRVVCHLCNSTNYRYDRCTQCGRMTTVHFSGIDEGNFCNECVEAAGDAWVSMQEDIWRGK